MAGGALAGQKHRHTGIGITTWVSMSYKLGRKYPIAFWRRPTVQQAGGRTTNHCQATHSKWRLFLSKCSNHSQAGVAPGQALLYPCQRYLLPAARPSTYPCHRCHGLNPSKVAQHIRIACCSLPSSATLPTFRHQCVLLSSCCRAVGNLQMVPLLVEAQARS